MCCLPRSSQLRPVRDPWVNAGAGRAERRPHRPPVQVPSTVPRPARMGLSVSQQRRCSLTSMQGHGPGWGGAGGERGHRSGWPQILFHRYSHLTPVVILRLGPRTHGFCHCFLPAPRKPGADRAFEDEPQGSSTRLGQLFYLFTPCQVAPPVHTSSDSSTCSHLVRWPHLFTPCQVAPWLKTHCLLERADLSWLGPA